MYREIGKKFKQGKEEPLKGEQPEFAKAIKQLRTESKLSLEKLSELTGIKRQTLHSIENRSIKNPSFANLEKIASALKLNLNELILRARAEFQGNLFKTTASERWSVSFETEKGFSIYSYSPRTASQRDFFVGVMTMQPKKKLRYWQFDGLAKACIQPWDADLLFVYHGLNWRREEHVLAGETLYYDASIPHTFENLSERKNRALLITYPSLF